MRRKAHQRIEPRSHDRPITPVAASGQSRPAYPSMVDAERSPELASLVRAAIRAAACIGLLGAAGAASGCEPPTCAPTRWGEVKAHAPDALGDVTRLHLGVAIDEVAVAFGISPHPAPAMMAGEMMMVAPSPAPPSGGDEPSGATE